jgi:hypothetical protein
MILTQGQNGQSSYEATLTGWLTKGTCGSDLLNSSLM